MQRLCLSMGEPFTSPAWNSNFVVFCDSETPYIKEDKTREYIAACCRYAKRFEVYLVPHRFVLQGFVCLCLIGPDGRVVGAQRACHLQLEQSAGLRRGSEISVLDTPFGNIFLCVDVDAYYPVVWTQAKGKGAQIMVASQHIPLSDYGSHMLVNGVWNAAQTAKLLVVSSTNHANSVLAPAELTTKKDGYLVAPTGKFPVTATLAAEILDNLSKKIPLSSALIRFHSQCLQEE